MFQESGIPNQVEEPLEIQDPLAHPMINAILVGSRAHSRLLLPVLGHWGMLKDVVIFEGYEKNQPMMSGPHTLVHLHEYSRNIIYSSFLL